MPTVLQFRRGTTSQNNAFTGALGELSVDTDKDTIRVHDGSTAGGFELLTAAMTVTLTNKSIDLTDNTLTGTTAEFNTALSDGSFATIAGTETLENKTLTSPVLNSATVGTSLVPASADGAALGSASAEFSDLFLADGGVINLGDDQDVTITHNADTGVTLKNTSTTGNGGIGAVLTLQTGDTDVATNNVLGSIQFQAPDEGTGTDAILVAAAVEAVSEGDFSATSNATKLSFKLGVSEAATEKARIESDGEFFCNPTSTLLIKNSSGTTLKTVNGVGST